MSRSTVLMLACAIARAQSGEPDAGAAAIGDFQKRVADYMKVHNAARSAVGKLKTTNAPERIDGLQKKLAHKIRESRQHVKQGNIFTAEIATAFRGLIGKATAGPHAATVHQSLRRGEQVAIPLKVNRSYPEGVPLPTTPPSLLLALPKLPPELEYRVVANALVLRDVEANIVVDYLPGAIP
jgi:hypothetical protein